MNYSRLLLLSVIPLTSFLLCGFKTAAPVKAPEVTEVLPETEPAKPLDLSIPMTIEPTTGNQANVKQVDTENFVVVDKTKRHAVQLDGNLLMSQELEAEKRKTLDGAGIVIKVQP